MKFCSVVLNYKSYGETLECVEALLNMNYADSEIVIVDNGSGNESVEMIEKSFSDNPRVHIIALEKNLGFAAGNNEGIYYAREKLGADFVYVCNSDTVSHSELFNDFLKAYKKGVGVITVPVIRPDGSYQLPDENTDDIMKRIRFSITHLLMGMILNRIRKGGAKQAQKVFEAPDSYKKYVLEGCAFCLTKDYFENYRGLYPKTFLYWEEKNLLYMIKKADLESNVAETAPVLHKVKGSTVTDDITKFRLNHAFKSMIKSLPLYSMSRKSISKKY